MARFTKQRSLKAGLPPGTPVHVGVRKEGAVRITVMDYDESRVEEKALRSAQECAAYRDRPTVTWINVDGVHDVAMVEAMGKLFGLHPLVVEDICSTGQRPKQEDYDECMYVVIEMLSYDEAARRTEAEQVSMILGKNFVLSFQERAGDVFDAVRGRIRSGKGRLRKAGADYLLYCLLDAIVDNYFTVCEKLGEEIEPLQDELVRNPSRLALQKIHELKAEMLFLRKAVWPLRELVSGLERAESPLFAPTTRVYLRDIYDHAAQLIDTLETYRDMVSGMMDVYLSSLSNRMNEVMKVLTIIATIFIPLTFVAGVYGMNFDIMPELRWWWGYPAVLFVMLVTAAGLLLYFRKRRWI